MKKRIGIFMLIILVFSFIVKSLFWGRDTTKSQKTYFISLPPSFLFTLEQDEDTLKHENNELEVKNSHIRFENEQLRLQNSQISEENQQLRRFE